MARRKCRNEISTKEITAGGRHDGRPTDGLANVWRATQPSPAGGGGGGSAGGGVAAAAPPPPLQVLIGGERQVSVKRKYGNGNKDEMEP